jgi:hypothetical protein
LTPQIVETLPAGWDSRLVSVPGSNRAQALDRYDLALVKLVLGREKDLNLLRALLQRELLTLARLREHYQTTALDEGAATKAGRSLRMIVG